MTRKETLERAYGNAPKEIPDPWNIFEWLPDRRAIRYVWLKWIVKKFFR